MPSVGARRCANACASLAVRWSESGCLTLVVAHDPASPRGGLDMEPRSWASLYCHHSPPAPRLGVAAQELAPADGHEPAPTCLRAQTLLAISACAHNAP
jgi:hypothetical protein